TAERRFASGAEAPWRDLPETLTLQVESAASEQIDDDIAGLRFFADGSSSGGTSRK
ncbi:MAG: type II secretion system protein GspH, partial [Gemmatimonadetes bacterium]|nr:type II secretion system protein GspH [Gemmatimonadota bacterium]